MPLAMGKRRKRWARDLQAKLHGRRRQRPEESEPGIPVEPPPAEPPARTADDSDHASPEEITAYRRVYRSPRDIAAETAYQKLMRICMDAKLERGIWMRLPTDDGALSDIQLVPTPITLPDETISARQFAAEWALLWGEVMAWVVGEAESAAISDDDHQFIKELTGNVPAMIVTKWCDAILNGTGKRREPRARPDRSGEEIK